MQESTSQVRQCVQSHSLVLTSLRGPEQRPTCRRCAIGHRQCTYGLKLSWPRINKRRTRHEHAENRPSKSHVFKKWHFLNFTAFDLASYFQFDVKDFGNRLSLRAEQYNMNECEPCIAWEEVMSSSTVKIISLPLSNLMPGISSQDSPLWSYYLSVLCASRTLVDDDGENTYLHIVPPLALTSETLLHAILAVSAQVLCLTNGRYRNQALVHNHFAVRSLSRALHDYDQDCPRQDELLAVIVTLCWYEVSNQSSPSWIVHLQGLLTHVRKLQELPKRSVNQPLLKFCQRYCAFHVVLARTTFPVDYGSQSAVSLGMASEPAMIPPVQSDPPFTGLTEWLSIYMPSASLNRIDPDLGISNALLLLINEVANISQERMAAFSSMDNSALSKVYRLRQSLSTLQQTLPSHWNDASEAAADLCSIAETNRLGALLLLHTVCPCREDQHVSHRDSLVQEIVDLVSKRIDRIKMNAILPLWPLFLAGCCASDECIQLEILKVFDSLEDVKRFGVSRPP